MIKQVVIKAVSNNCSNYSDVDINAIANDIEDAVKEIINAYDSDTQDEEIKSLGEELSAAKEKITSLEITRDSMNKQIIKFYQENAAQSIFIYKLKQKHRKWSLIMLAGALLQAITLLLVRWG